MKNIITVAIAVIHKNGKFLLTERRGQDPDDEQFGLVWHFPGGAVEHGETIENALIREIKEELNLNVKIIHQLPVHSAIRPGWHGILIPHLCEIEGEENIILNSESHSYRWYTIEQIQLLKKLPFVQNMAEDASLISTAH